MIPIRKYPPEYPGGRCPVYRRMTQEDQDRLIKLLRANPGKFFRFASKAANQEVLVSKLRGGAYRNFPPKIYQVELIDGQTYIAYNPRIDEY